MHRVFFAATIGLILAAPNRAEAAGTAPIQAAICSEIDSSIDEAEKEISAKDLELITENSAPRASVDYGEIGALFASIQANIQLAANHHCPPYSHPIKTDAYSKNAMACSSDRTNNALAGNFRDIPTSCDRKIWQRD